MASEYIAHYYPQADADNFFQPDTVIECIGPVFSSHAEAVSHLDQELVDITEHNLPVGAYVLEVEKAGDGYRIIEVIDLSEDTDDNLERTDNPRGARNNKESGMAKQGGKKTGAANKKAAAATRRRPQRTVEELAEPASRSSAARSSAARSSAARSSASSSSASSASASNTRVSRPYDPEEDGDIDFSPVGEFTGDEGSASGYMFQLRGIETGDRVEGLDDKRGATRYGRFMAKYSPSGVSQNMIKREFSRAIGGPAALRSKRDESDLRDDGLRTVSGLMSSDAENFTHAEAIADCDAAVAELYEAEVRGEITREDRIKGEAAQSKRKEFHEILLRFCRGVVDRGGLKGGLEDTQSGADLVQVGSVLQSMGRDFDEARREHEKSTNKINAANQRAKDRLNEKEDRQRLREEQKAGRKIKTTDEDLAEAEGELDAEDLAALEVAAPVVGNRTRTRRSSNPAFHHLHSRHVPSQRNAQVHGRHHIRRGR